MIYLVVALPAEARPLIAHFDLEPEREPELVYRRQDMALIVSGVGREASGAAVETLAEAVPADAHCGWVNIGVAGHRSRAIGEVVVAQSVTDEESGDRWQLSTPTDLQLPVGEVLTVQRVEVEYEGEVLYEMEAAGFCDRAARHTAADLVQVVKIISDNRESGSLCVSAHKVQELVEAGLPALERLISYLHRRARTRSAEDHS